MLELWTIYDSPIDLPGRFVAHGPSRLAARLVLVDGLTQADAAHAHKVEPNALNNSVRRYREFDRAIREAYGLNGGR